MRQRPVQRLLHERREREEVTYTTGAESAEMQAGGLRINSMPKDGGNTFSGTFFAYGAGSALQADNRSDEVKPFITTRRDRVHYQFNPSFGGPLKRDKLWFYFTYKYRGQQDLRRQLEVRRRQPAVPELHGQLQRGRPAHLAGLERDKIRFYLEKQFNGEFYNGFNTLPTTTPEASTDAFGDGWVPQIKWTQTPSNKLLLDAGISYYYQPYEQNYRESRAARPGAPRTTTNLLTVAAGNTIPPYTSWTKNYSSLPPPATSPARTRSRPA